MDKTNSRDVTRHNSVQFTFEMTVAHTAAAMILPILCTVTLHAPVSFLIYILTPYVFAIIQYFLKIKKSSVHSIHTIFNMILYY